MNYHILIADDESNITDVCRRYLEREGHRVSVAGDGEQALEIWRREHPELLVLDVMMPGISGLQVCETIRNEHDVPIILLTARGEEQDRIMGLTMGADDYMTKPFSPRELVLRIKAIMRRMQRFAASGEMLDNRASFAIQCGSLEIDEGKRRVKLSGKEVDLTVKEFDLLLLLAGHPDQVFSRNQLLNHLWDIDYYGDTTTVTVHIRRLREKIEDNPSDPQRIKTVWGIGYKFDGSEM